MKKKNSRRGKRRHLLLGNDTDVVASVTSSSVTIINWLIGIYYRKELAFGSLANYEKSMTEMSPHK